MKEARTYIITLMVVFMTTACEHKDLVFDSDNMYKVRISFNNDSTSAEGLGDMRVFFYRLIENGEYLKSPLIFQVSAATGGTVMVPEGVYHVLAYNVSPYTREYDRDKFYQFRLSTERKEVTVYEEDDSRKWVDESREAEARGVQRTLFGEQVPKSQAEPDFPYYDTPEYTCRARIDNFVVQSPEAAGIYDYEFDSPPVVNNLSMALEPAVCTVNLHLTGVKNISMANVARGTLSGIPTSKNVSSGMPTGELGVVAYVCSIDYENSSIDATFSVWGLQSEDHPNTDADSRQFVNIYIWANSGKFHFYQDITDDISSLVEARGLSADFNGDFDIDLSEVIDLSNKDGTGNSGFSPAVNGWNQEHFVIDL